MYQQQRDGFYYEVQNGMCVGRPLTEQEAHQKMAEEGVQHFRAQGATWHTAGERAAESLIGHLSIDPSSTDAFSLRAAFAATARNLAARERGL